MHTILTSDGGAYALITGILVLSWWATSKITTINANHGSLMRSLEKHDGFIDELRKDISYIKGSIELIKVNQVNDLAQAHSPISLTDKGVEAAQTMNAGAIINANWAKINAQLESSVKDQNAYDIQQYCIETAAVEPEKFFSQNEILQLKQFAFQTGKSFQAVSIVPAILIRDRYLTEKNIPIAEIDLNDPNKKQNS